MAASGTLANERIERGEAQLISIIRGDSRVRLQVDANRGERQANEVERMNIN